MILNDDKIPNFGVSSFVFLSVVNIGILFLPSLLVNDVNNDAWLLIILAGAISIFLLYIICKTGNKYCNLGFVETLRFLFGKVIGTVLAIPVAIYALLFISLELRLFAEVTKIYLLHNTPLEFIIYPMIILTVILARMGLEPITRTFGILLPVVILIILALILVFTQKSDISNLRPYLTTPPLKYIKGLSSNMIAFAGFEVMLVIFPYIREPKSAFKASMKGMVFVIALYAILTIQCITGLGSEETKALVWPVMALTKSISIPGGFLEGLEGLLSSAWVILVFTSLVAFLYFFSVTAAGIFKHKKPKHFVSLALPIIYIIALQGESIPNVFTLSNNVMKYFGTYTMIILPLLMYAFSFIRGNSRGDSRGDSRDDSPNKNN